jgi:hypothetical protein
MSYWFFSGEGRRLRRTVIPVGRKYALFRLNTRLTQFSDARLDRWTSRAGIERSDLFTVFKGNAAHRQLMARMLVHFNVEPTKACARCWQVLRGAEAVCARCPNVGRCRRWFRWGRKNHAPDVFCPNAALFRELESLQHAAARDGCQSGRGLPAG